ncbi:hypothetical protein M8J77_013573 [Diaphorina citri]|nr:hypothetical protein M8J77_013573 [Diaphorina citri]
MIIRIQIKLEYLYSKLTCVSVRSSATSVWLGALFLPSHHPHSITCLWKIRKPPVTHPQIKKEEKKRKKKKKKEKKKRKKR